MLLGIAALGTSAALCGAGGIALAVLRSRGGGDLLDWGNPPPPGNPKGSFYEQPDAPVLPLPGNPKGSLYEAPDVPPPDAGLVVLPPPGNPKGSFYEEPVVPVVPSPTPPPPSKR